MDFLIRNYFEVLVDENIEVIVMSASIRFRFIDFNVLRRKTRTLGKTYSKSNKMRNII